MRIDQMMMITSSLRVRSHVITGSFEKIVVGRNDDDDEGRMISQAKM